jgi:hypothetical protein
MIGSTGTLNLDNYIEKSTTVGLVKNDGTIDETEYATVAELNTKQDTIVGTQLDALNSGANATNIAQIETNTSDIANKQDKILTTTSGFLLTSPTTDGAQPGTRNPNTLVQITGTQTITGLKDFNPARVIAASNFPTVGI